MKTILRAIVFSIVVLISVSTATRAQNDGNTQVNSDFLNGAGTNGAWRINYAESDNPLLKMQTFLQNKLVKSASEKNNDGDSPLPTLSVSLVPPETLVLASEEEKSVTINEGFNEIVFTRTVVTDGVKRSGELPNGINFSITARQQRDFLKVETASPRGNRMIETYALADAGKKLVVTVRFEDAQAKEMLTLRRIYDRTLLDIFSNGTEEIQ